MAYCGAKSLAPLPGFYRDRYCQMHSTLGSGVESVAETEDGAHKCVLPAGHEGPHALRTCSPLAENKKFESNGGCWTEKFEWETTYVWSDEHALHAGVNIRRTMIYKPPGWDAAVASGRITF